MWFKRKVKEEDAPLTEEEFRISMEYAEDLLANVLAGSGKGVHLMQVRTTAMENVNFLYGQNGHEFHHEMPLDELTARVATRSHFLGSFLITLVTFRNLDPAILELDIIEEYDGPDELYGWLIKDLKIIPLTAKQIFDFWYSDEDDEAAVEALKGKAVLQTYPFGDATGKVAYRDAWTIDL